ncbi:hypothetical protein GJ744_008686 [Endocarpon pusillum]|uniref:Large ribosomal subunit protein uL29m n=1 Tax=Endocarpon pusillum TaxID=364733 RepID=A0A8H7E355_9EURO|nr:hypothetical protein GJ744_008686 [Endocarpon pusillum]
MASHSVLRLSRSAQIDSRYMPPVFLAPALQPFLCLTTSNTASQATSHHHHHHQHHPFSTTPPLKIRLRNREKNKSRGVSAIRRTGPRVPLSMSKYPLPEPVWDPPSRKEFKTRDDHGLWGFFNEKRTAMTAPEDLDAHGRAWTTAELAKKSWEDLWTIWWRCVRERNYLATEANERHRVAAGYGEAESKERVAEVVKTMRRIRDVLRDRQYAYDEAQNIVDTAEFWREEIEANERETREDDFSPLEGEESKHLLEQLKGQRPMA